MDVPLYTLLQTVTSTQRKKRASTPNPCKPKDDVSSNLVPHTRHVALRTHNHKHTHSSLKPFYDLPVSTYS